MARTQTVRSIRREKKMPALENGDRLDQKTFHVRYLAMPENVRAELIGGIVYMSSPMKRPHGRYQFRLIRWMGEYESATPGIEGLDNTTQILGPESEPQPDGCLFILPECGGQTWEDDDGYMNGAPEFVGEISHASESIDLNAKKTDYDKAGVREYLVVALRSKQVFWFIRRHGKLKEMAAGSDGIFRSEVFPGLWLDPAGFLRPDGKRVLAVLRQGLDSPEHEAFVTKLAKK